MPSDQRDLLCPGEIRDHLASGQASHRLPHQPQVAQDAATQHHGVDAALPDAADAVVRRPQVTAARHRDPDGGPDLRDRGPVRERVISLGARPTVHRQALDTGGLQPGGHLEEVPGIGVPSEADLGRHRNGDRSNDGLTHAAGPIGIAQQGRAA